MSKIRFSEDHEYIRLEDGAGTVGITPFAQEQLGDIVFVELPEVGRTVAAGDACAIVESVKTASDIYAPVSGEITGINQAVVDDPAMVNSEPYGGGWFFKIHMTNPDETSHLLDADAYGRQVE